MNVLSEKKVYTYDDINSLPDGNYEIIDGETVAATPAGFRQGKFEYMPSGKLMIRFGIICQ